MTGKLLANRTNRTISSDQRIADPRNVATLRERVETAGSPRFIPVRRGKEKIRKIWSQNLEQNSLFFHFRFLHFLNRFRIIPCIFRGRKLRNENFIISTKNLSREERHVSPPLIYNYRAIVKFQPGKLTLTFRKLIPRSKKLAFMYYSRLTIGRNRNNSLVKNNLNRRNPTYVTTLQNTHLRAHVTRHDWQQRILPIL